MFGRTLFISVALFFCALPGWTSQSESMSKGYALLIGVNDYSGGSLNSLTTPCKDIEDIKNAMVAFERILIEKPVCDKSAADIFILIREFYDKVQSEEGQFGIIYFSGHGVQVLDNIYMFGAKANPNPKDFAKLFASSQKPGRNGQNLFSLKDAVSLKDIGPSGTRGNPIVIIIDACRDSPIFENFGTSQIQLSGSGINLIRPPIGSLLAFSAAHGSKALEKMPDTGKSPYAEAMIEALLIPNLSATDLFTEIRRRVRDKTERLHWKQEPSEINSLEDVFCLANCIEYPCLNENTKTSTSTYNREKQQTSTSNLQNPQYFKTAWGRYIPTMSGTTEKKHPSLFTIFRRQPEAYGALTESPVNKSQMRVDVFWCEGNEKKQSFLRAEKAAATLYSLANEEKDVEASIISEIRIRSLSETQNSRPGYHFESDGINYNPEDKVEVEWTRVIREKINVKPIIATGATPGYISLFFCERDAISN